MYYFSYGFLSRFVCLNQHKSSSEQPEISANLTYLEQTVLSDVLSKELVETATIFNYTQTVFFYLKCFS